MNWSSLPNNNQRLYNGFLAIIKQFMMQFGVYEYAKTTFHKGKMTETHNVNFDQ